MKFYVKIWIMVALLVAAIGYTVYSWVIGEIDMNTAVMYILVLCFPMARMLSAFVQGMKDANQ